MKPIWYDEALILHYAPTYSNFRKEREKLEPIVSKLQYAHLKPIWKFHDHQQT